MFVVYDARPDGALLGQPGALLSTFGVSAVMHNLGDVGARAGDGVPHCRRVLPPGHRGGSGARVLGTDEALGGRDLGLGMDDEMDTRPERAYDYD